MMHYITLALNQQLHCTRCRMLADWRGLGRCKHRRNSIIRWYRCHNCNEHAVVKLPRCTDHSSSDSSKIRREYRTLLELQARFPNDSRFGTLVPLGLIDVHGLPALVTRGVIAEPLLRFAHRMGASRIHDTFGTVGALLRKLHECCPRADKLQPLEVDSKIRYLYDTYSDVLFLDPALRTTLNQFRRMAELVHALPLRAPWHHGDFTPDNVLVSEHKYLVTDTDLGFDSAFVYDIASFLNHLQIAGKPLLGAALRRHYGAVEAAFLSGYGGLEGHELHALRWAQMYFMLCYLGRSRRRRAAFMPVYGGRIMKQLLGTLSEDLMDVTVH